MTNGMTALEREAHLLAHIADLERALAMMALRYGNTDEIRRLLAREMQREIGATSH